MPPLPALIAFCGRARVAASPRASSGHFTRKLLRPFGAPNIEPVPFSDRASGLLLFYCGTWVIGGFRGLVHAAQPRCIAPPVSTIPFLGGVSAVGANRRGARRLRPLRARRRARALHVRAAASRVTSAGPALGVDRPQPSRDHDRRARRSSGSASPPGVFAPPHSGPIDLTIAPLRRLTASGIPQAWRPCGGSCAASRWAVAGRLRPGGSRQVEDRSRVRGPMARPSELRRDHVHDATG